MKIAIIGGSGFIGSNLRREWKNHDLTIIKGRDILAADGSRLKELVSGQDILINLAGKSVFGYWTRKRKKMIWSSRVELTGKIVEVMRQSESPPTHFINASAVGIYESESEVSESSGWYSNNFLAEVVKNWEKEAFNAKDVCERVTLIRIGVVLGKEGGMYSLMRNLVKWNLGAYFGKGEQSLSFIYIRDLVRAIDFIIDNRMDGIINLTAPEYTNYRTFMSVLKGRFKSFILWPIPEFLIKTGLGEMSVMVLEGQRVRPGKLLEKSFNFEAPTIQECIKKIENP